MRLLTVVAFAFVLASFPVGSAEANEGKANQSTPTSAPDRTSQTPIPDAFPHDCSESKPVS